MTFNLGAPNIHSTPQNTATTHHPLTKDESEPTPRSVTPGDSPGRSEIRDRETKASTAGRAARLEATSGLTSKRLAKRQTESAATTGRDQADVLTASTDASWASAKVGSWVAGSRPTTNAAETFGALPQVRSQHDPSRKSVTGAEQYGKAAPADDYKWGRIENKDRR